MFEFTWHIAQDKAAKAGSGSQLYSTARDAAQACFDFTEEHSLMLMTHDWSTISYSQGMRFHQDCYNTMLRVEGNDWEPETEVLAFICRALRKWDEGFQADNDEWNPTDDVTGPSGEIMCPAGWTDHDDGESVLSIKKVSNKRLFAKTPAPADKTQPRKKKRKTNDDTKDTTSTKQSQ